MSAPWMYAKEPEDHARVSLPIHGICHVLHGLANVIDGRVHFFD
jgi:hypothetical protein